MTRFHPAPGVYVFQERVLDIADAANEFSLVRAPSSVAGLQRASGLAAAVYGTGLTRLLAVPLPPREADEIANQLTASGAAKEGGLPLLRSGPLGAVVTRGTGALGVRWLVAGTVTDQTLLTRRTTWPSGLDHDDPHPRAHQAVRQRPRGRRARPRRCDEGDVYGFLGPERLGQDDHGPDAARSGAGHVGERRAARAGDARPRRRGAPPGRRAGRGAGRLPAAVRAGEPRALRRHGGGRDAERPGATRRRRPRPGRSRRGRRPPGPRLLPGHAAAAGAGRGADPAAARCWSSTSPPTAWTRRASGRSAICCSG